MPLPESASEYLLASAQNRHADRIAGLVLVHDRADVLRIGDLLAVDSHNQVAAQHDGRVAHIGLLIAAMQTRPFRRAAWNHLLNQHAVIRGQSHLLGQVRPDRIRNNAQRRPLHAPIASQIAPAPPWPY